MSPRRVLVVDDDGTVGRLVRMNLAAEGFDVQVVNSGQEALEIANSQPPDCILLDVMMPEMDGLEVCRRLKHDERTISIPVIMVTAKAGIDDKLEAFQLGADDYISKPFDLYELSARLRAVMSRASYARIAAENASLLLEARQRQQEAETLHRLATQVAGMRDLAQVLQFVAAAARDLLQADASTVRLWSDGSLRLRAQSPDRLPYPPPGETALAERVARRQLPRGALAAQGSIELNPDGSARPDLLALSVTIMGTEPLGALSVWATLPRKFPPRQCELLGALATQAAIAIENHALQEHTLRLSITDPLTEVANHRELLSRLDLALESAQQRNQPLSLLMVDIDNFKEINDAFGHPTGDQVLRGVAAFLAAACRPPHLVARYGGDEFVVVLPDTTADRAYATAQRLATDVAGLTIPELFDRVHLSVSVGIATFPEDGRHRRSLIQAADQAMYFAKHEDGVRISRIDTSIQTYERDPARLHALLERANLATIEALAAAIEARDPYTHGHTERVGEYAVAIAAELGLPPKDWQALRLAALLHDIGKIGISDAVLKKPARLTPREYETIKEHSRIGYEMLKSVPFLKEELPIILHHHESVDGSGYPAGLKGDAIPVGSRVLLVADALDAMTSDRTYRKALPLEEALRRLRAASGSQFDAGVVQAALRCLDKGSIVIHGPSGLQAA